MYVVSSILLFGSSLSVRPDFFFPSMEGSLRGISLTVLLRFNPNKPIKPDDSFCLGVLVARAVDLRTGEGRLRGTASGEAALSAGVSSRSIRAASSLVDASFAAALFFLFDFFSGTVHTGRRFIWAVQIPSPMARLSHATRRRPVPPTNQGVSLFVCGSRQPTAAAYLPLVSRLQRSTLLLCIQSRSRRTTHNARLNPTRDNTSKKMPPLDSGRTAI